MKNTRFKGSTSECATYGFAYRKRVHNKIGKKRIHSRVRHAIVYMLHVRVVNGVFIIFTDISDDGRRRSQITTINPHKYMGRLHNTFIHASILRRFYLIKRQNVLAHHMLLR